MLEESVLGAEQVALVREVGVADPVGAVVGHEEAPSLAQGQGVQPRRSQNV